MVVEIPIEKGDSQATGEVLGNFLITSGTTRGYQFGVSAKLNGRKLSGQNSYTYGAGGAGINECRSLVLISAESSKEDIRRTEALAEMARTGHWFSQEQFVTQSTRSSAFCDVRNMPSNWLGLSSLEQISISFEDLERIDAKGLDCLNHYVLAGGFLAVSKVQSQQAVAKYLPIDLARMSGDSKRDKSRNGTQASKLQLSDFQSPSLDPFEDTVWDRYQLAAGRAFLKGEGTVPMTDPYAPPVTFPDIYEATDWLSENVIELGTNYLDSQLASPIAFASEIYDAATFLEETPKGTFRVAHGFGTVYLDSRRRPDSANILEENLGQDPI